MNYKETLETARAANIRTWELLVADEVAVAQENEELKLADDKAFEAVCEFVYDWVMHSECPARELLEYMFKYFKENQVEVISEGFIDESWSDMVDTINSYI